MSRHIADVSGAIAPSDFMTDSVCDDPDSPVSLRERRYAGAQGCVRRARTIQKLLDRARRASELLPAPGRVWENSRQDFVTNWRQNLIHVDAMNWFARGYLLCISQQAVQQFWGLPAESRFPLFTEVLVNVTTNRKAVSFADERIQDIVEAYKQTFSRIMRRHDIYVALRATAEMFPDLPFERA
ncbi:hypothetical protein DACRYDRAFT_103202 [Dacryopinax primogenitus]|uniref:Uncharacterized protein n=1 Tax=Dacryopinax primogenitus (strain DJM 731) TaxID=1858805 RepID=M5G7S6_DACPD|nr:uncharacterized protein DACRYDRAFT_103202 [Dacryopinax primogenitus]EJU06256.1 hypothetical protein DACRYDRAFT_103202 [Dacryopinax primogenitus]